MAEPRRRREKCVAAHRSCLAEPALAAAGDDAAPAAEAALPDPSGKFAERVRAKHELVHRLRAEGRWQAQRPSKLDPFKLDPFKPYLDQHAGGGHGSFTRLFKEIRELGYDGSCPVVRSYLDKHRPAKTPMPQAPPAVREVTNWLTRHPAP